MRSCMFVIIDFYTEHHQLNAFPSDSENLAMQMQDKIQAKSESICQCHDEENCDQKHCRGANALYKGTLGALPAGYGNIGHLPIDATVACAYSVLLSQPHEQNDVNNPVTANQPHCGDETPPPSAARAGVTTVQGGGTRGATVEALPGGGAGMVAAVQGGRDGVAAVLAPFGNRVKVDPEQGDGARVAAVQAPLGVGLHTIVPSTQVLQSSVSLQLEQLPPSELMLNRAPGLEWLLFKLLLQVELHAIGPMTQLLQSSASLQLEQLPPMDLLPFLWEMWSRFIADVAQT